MTLDEQLLEQLFKQHFRELSHFAFGYVKDSEIAREIVQDSFVSLWLKRDTIDPEREVKSYLSTTVRNKCLNHLRDNRKFSKELIDLEQVAGAIPFTQPDNLDHKDLQDQIDTAIAELPEKCREVFILSRYENLRYQEIATQLNISVKTVETQITKALRHLRARLAPYLSLLLILAFFSAVRVFLHFRV